MKEELKKKIFQEGYESGYRSCWQDETGNFIQLELEKKKKYCEYCGEKFKKNVHYCPKIRIYQSEEKSRKNNKKAYCGFCGHNLNN